MRVSASHSVVAEDGEMVSDAGGCSIPIGGSSGAGSNGQRGDDRCV